MSHACTHRSQFAARIGWISILLGAILAAGPAATLASAQEPTVRLQNIGEPYRERGPAMEPSHYLVEPSGQITANVFFSRGQMIVDDANGTRYLFQRDRDFDSIDRRFIGYWNSSLNRVIRFPRSGRGTMEVTDLDDPYPTYVRSRRSVRPARRSGGPRPIHPPLDYIPPSLAPGAGYPPYGDGYGYGYGYLNEGISLGVGPIGPGRPWHRPPPQSTLLESEVVPREPLPPVTINLQNPGPRELRVTVNDLFNEAGTQQIRIAAGQTVPIQVQRDAGADRVQQVLTYAPDGRPITQEVVTPMPPVSRYELVVHEWRLQSVAIDRTGKSPNVIEDTQFQGRGLGRFTLPPGDQLTGGTIDVLRSAQAADNAGAVAPLVDDTNPDGTPAGTRPLSDLERILLQQQRASGR
ncbi:hypothetical protein FYK55_00970 [Roseiconus nitratireducens]|uniref:Uncharacterized protein n=1 Tax=Roseiconus nitratireducens TaxID=2605748 RepID=A0A5M6DL94_9BACT|nr:hypothetical protein [Roseiconus nitratireducens]KAA5547022.1 hypothetical protein FYK55_00970 [Roseiconus nitratireducens]